MNVLITGANGQLGKCFQEIISSKATAFIDDLLCHNYFFADHKTLDITNKENIEEYVINNNINVIINCAAYTNVDNAEDNVNDALHINFDGVSKLAEICKNKGIKLIHISTDYVFDGNGNTPYTTEDGCNPMCVYGVSKRLGEEAIVESGCDYLIFRTSWLYSEYNKNFVTNMINLFKERKELNIVYDQIGSPTYALCLADFILHIIETDKIKNKTGIYHYSNKGVTSWYDFTKHINSNCATYLEKFFGVDIKPCRSSEFKTKARRPAYSVLDCSKTERDFDVTIDYWVFALNTMFLKMSLHKC